MSTGTVHSAAETDALLSKQFELTRRFTLAILDDPLLGEEIPNGATLVLLPDDDPSFVELEIALGVAAARRGQNVYFRHVRMADLPDIEDNEIAPPVGLRRTFFNWDGSVHTAEVMEADGSWRDVDPTDTPPADRPPEPRP